MAKTNTWRKPRHKVVFTLLLPLLRPFVRWRYHITAEPFPAHNDRPYLIIMNHQTGFDQFFPCLIFRQPIYFIASEDIFSLGWVSALIRWLVAPIPIKKQTTDLQAVKNCIRVAREGGTICLAPEGNRTFHGKTVYIKPSIASLAKKLGLPVAVLRIEGGYGIQPRWSDVVRKGKMRCYIKRVIEPEEYAGLSRDAFAQLLQQELTVDEARVTGEFHHRKNAEFLERVVYTCPDCGFSPFESHDDVLRCTTCGQQVRHLPTKELEGVDKPFPHRFVADWYEWQNDYVNRSDLSNMTAAPVFTDTARFSRVHVGKRKELLIPNASVCLYGDRITVDDRVFPFDTVDAVVVLGKNKINIYQGKDLFQLKGGKRFNALKYVNFFHRYNNIIAGEHNEFLGL